jgi:hypothetical protein
VTVIYPFSEAEAVEKGIPTVTREGIVLIFSARPIALTGEGEGLSTLEVLHNHGQADEYPLDYLLVDSGRLPEMLFVRGESDRWRTVELSRVFAGNGRPGIFADGQGNRSSDLARVVEAIGRGRKIARAVHLAYQDEEVAPEAHVLVDESRMQQVDTIDNAEDLKFPGRHFDPAKTLEEAESLQQVDRCLQCGIICYDREPKGKQKEDK